MKTRGALFLALWIAATGVLVASSQFVPRPTRPLVRLTTVAMRDGESGKEMPKNVAAMLGFGARKLPYTTFSVKDVAGVTHQVNVVIADDLTYLIVYRIAGDTGNVEFSGVRTMPTSGEFLNGFIRISQKEIRKLRNEECQQILDAEIAFWDGWLDQQLAA